MKTPEEFKAALEAEIGAGIGCLDYEIPSGAWEALIRARDEEIRREEREACAKLIPVNWSDAYVRREMEKAVAAIRARK